MAIFETDPLNRIPKGLRVEPYYRSDEEMRQETFRVVCLAYNRETLCYCGHGTGMTVDELNSNLRCKGRSEIVIPYCKYCNQEKTPGFFDDNPALMGVKLWFPEEHPSRCFVLERMNERESELTNTTGKTFRKPLPLV